MISAGYAENDGKKAFAREEITETAVVVENIRPVPDLIVVDLNESTENVGLPRDIISQLGEVMAYPKDVKEANEKECVLVEFTYDDEGYIHVANTTSTNESFDDHVVTNIEKIRLRNGSVTIGKQYFAKFSFKRL